MADFIRRIVSGNKARFKDETLDVELDLAYITDRVIVMGYPATGLEGLYRNRREDAKRFLEHRHGKNYWVFNFCPIRENSYPASFFDGRVSRYPFPDHHAPPLAILPLVAREIRLWLEGSPDRVAVLHCKAGKGRSGTMACAYLLTQVDLPSGDDSKAIQLAEERAEELMDAMPSDDDAAEETVKAAQEPTYILQEPDQKTAPPADAAVDGQSIVDSKATMSLRPVSVASDISAAGSGTSTPAQSKASTATLQHVLDLHTSKRMKPSSLSKTKDKDLPKPPKVKQGVSIPSQRRWLSYWSLLLAHEGPPGFWSLSSPSDAQPSLSRKVRLREMTIRMREPTGVKASLVKAVNAVIDRNAFAKTATGDGLVWASLARYDDEFVEVLEGWERWTREEDGDVGRRRRGSEVREGEELGGVFADGRWDKVKMVRSFARLGAMKPGQVEEGDKEDEKIHTYNLKPLSREGWGRIKDEIEYTGDKAGKPGGVKSEATSIHEVLPPATEPGISDSGVVLDPARELRIKMYMGQIFMGWFWFIPAFHIPPQTYPHSPNSEPVRLVFEKKVVDFPLGIGSNIIDVEVVLEPLTGEEVEPPARATSVESAQGIKSEPAGAAAVVAGVTVGNVAGIVEAEQAARD